MELREVAINLPKQVITAPDAWKECNVLAGYGVADRAGFCVYEFPKKITYYKVEIDKTALVNQQSIDEAKVECIVNKNGEIQTFLSSMVVEGT